MQDDLLTIAEVAQILRVDNTTVRRWAIGGALDVVRLPSRTGKRRGYRIQRVTLEHILETPATGVRDA